MTDATVLTFVLSTISAAIGAFAGSYLKKRGEFRALKEAFEEIKEQLRASTRLTESIKANISVDLWLAQERWKLKKDLYQSLLATLHEASDIIGSFDNEEVNEKESVARKQRLESELRKAQATAHLVSQKAVDIIQSVISPDPGPFNAGSEDEILSRFQKIYETAYRELAHASKEDLMLGVVASEA